MLCGALNVAREWGIILKTPRYRELRPREQTIRFLSRIEASALVAAADEPYKTMLIVALNTGLRIGELLALQWCDIYFDTRKMVVRRNLWRNQVGSPKSGKSREIALNGAVIAALTYRPRGQVPWVFSRADGRPLSHACCRRPLLRACKVAKIGALQWHILRHTFASHLVASSVPLRDVQRLLGHANYVTTERYTHLMPHAAQNAVEKLNFTL